MIDFSRKNYEIIDAHVHPFLEDCGANIGCYGVPRSPDEFVDELKRCGIDHACGSVLLLKKDCSMADIRRANRAALRFRDRYPGFYFPGIHVHGGFVKESIAELEAMRKEGVRWIGELVPYIMGTGLYNTPGMLELFGCAAENGMVVNIHDGWPKEMILPAVEKYPSLKLVMAHPGESGTAKERFQFAAEHENVHLDICGTGLFRWGMLEYAVKTCGSKKLLFGSDFPVCSPGMNLYGALSEHLTDDQFRDVLSGNFRRLTGLNS